LLLLTLGANGEHKIIGGSKCLNYAKTRVSVVTWEQEDHVVQVRPCCVRGDVRDSAILKYARTRVSVVAWDYEDHVVDVEVRPAACAAIVRDSAIIAGMAVRLLYLLMIRMFGGLGLLTRGDKAAGAENLIRPAHGHFNDSDTILQRSGSPARVGSPPVTGR
jgi:hypothetical protein